MGRRLLRLLRRGGAPELRDVHPAGGGAPDQLHYQGAVRRRRRHRALQLSAPAARLEGGPGAGGREHAGLQAAAPEPALHAASGPLLRRAAERRGQCDHRSGRHGRGAGPAPRRRLIAFTGSVSAGRRIAAQAGQELKKVNLELGSVDPFIVFADADLDVAVPAWRGPGSSTPGRSAPLRNGSTCSSHRPRVHRAARRLRPHLRVGDPSDPAADVGPLISADARHGRAPDRGRGAPGRQGPAGRVPDPARRAPGPLPRAHHSHRRAARLVAHHGGDLRARPSLTVAASADEAIAMANDSRYGLGASIYTNDLGTAMRAMQEIKAGTFWINDPLTDNDAGPFGGMRWSGVGRELGEEGLDAFREPKHVHLDYVMERKSYWYPYRDRPIPGHGRACGLGRTPARKVTSDQTVSSHPPPTQSRGSSIRSSSASKSRAGTPARTPTPRAGAGS